MSIPENKTLQRIHQLCNERNWSLYRLAKEADVPYSSLSNMFSRNTQPTVSTLEKICSGFGISMIDFFNTPAIINPNCYVLNSDEKEIIDIYRSLPKRKKELLNAYMQGIMEI